MPAHDVLFGASLGQWNGADAADAAGRIRLGTQADRDGLDLFTVADHPYFGDKLDAYALTGVPARPDRTHHRHGDRHQPAQPSRAGTGAHAHLTVRAVRRAGHPGHRGGAIWDMITKLGVPGSAAAPRCAPWPRRSRWSARCPAGERGHLRRRALPRGWPGPGRHARSTGVYRLGRPEVPGRHRAAGRRLDPAGRLGLAEPALPRVASPRRRRRGRSRTGPGGRSPTCTTSAAASPPTRSPPPAGDDGRWIGGSVRQWIDELTTAVLDHHAVGFIYRNTDDTPADEALARWATEIVPAVRAAITR